MLSWTLVDEPYDRSRPVASRGAGLCEPGRVRWRSWLYRLASPATLAPQPPSEAIRLGSAPRSRSDMARSMGLNTIGLLGVLLNAKKLGVLPEIMPVVEELRSVAGFWIGRDVVDRMRQLADE